MAFVDSALSTSRGRAKQEETRRKPRKSILLLFEIKRDIFSLYVLVGVLTEVLSGVQVYKGKGEDLVFPPHPGEPGCPPGLDFGSPAPALLAGFRIGRGA